MGVIFDGHIWLGLAGGVMDRQRVIAAAGEAPVFTSSISLGEMRFGVEVCADPAERAIRAAWLRQVEGLLDPPSSLREDPQPHVENHGEHH